MKRIIPLLAIFAFTLGSCAQLDLLVHPIVGTWQTTVIGITTTLTYAADGSCAESSSIGGLSLTKAGTWTSDDNAIYRTWADATTSTDYFWFNSDKSQMTLSKSADGLLTVYTRQ